MKKSKTNISVVNNVGTRVKAEIVIGGKGEYTSGNILDANATSELVQAKVGELVGGAAEDFDTFKEIADSIVNKTTLDSFHATWTAITSDYTTTALANQIFGDDTIKVGQVYYGTINTSDLPDGNHNVPVKVYIDKVDEIAPRGENRKKQITFVVDTVNGTYKYTQWSEELDGTWVTLSSDNPAKWISMTEDVSGKADIADLEDIQNSIESAELAIAASLDQLDTNLVSMSGNVVSIEEATAAAISLINKKVSFIQLSLDNIKTRLTELENA